MGGKQGNLQVSMFVVGFILAALAIIFLFHETMGGFSKIIIAIVALSFMSVVGWFILDHMH
ncbi:hypothetical protein AYK26_05575 [Euryarchaeota archaeon SM23-78]|nr:MAG: hypothetical protein AYK26_05575 [Euryarchaeota archaeon SM23-78]MBW3000822.1 hypothetical protein [Candidatus Woesearchaeota archaeon]